MISMEDLPEELLECARYGEDDDLKAILTAGIDANYQDDTGTTALHRAAANGHVGCLAILHAHGALFKPNTQLNTPLHWAAQNGQAEAIKWLLAQYEVDVLEKNTSGRSALTEAFQSKNADCIELVLSHPSASEEKLMGGCNEEADLETAAPADAVTHCMQFTSETPLIKVRELPITRADHPFGSEDAPEDDTTGLGLWPASVLLGAYLARNTAEFVGQVVIELGAGCGLPGLTAAACGAKRVFITDIHTATLTNAEYNVTLNQLDDKVTVSKVNWKDASTFPELRADVLIGSDLVYDKQILTLLVATVQAMLSPEGSFLYIAPNTGRDGMVDLISSLKQVGIECVEQVPVPAE